MIALQSDCLLFQLASGESVPCSAEMISVELTGNADGRLDPEVLRHATASVFHYFKNDLERESVTVATMWSARPSIACGVTGRFWQAFLMPARSFSRENSSRRPSRLRTISPSCSSSS